MVVDSFFFKLASLLQRKYELGIPPVGQLSCGSVSLLFFL